MTGRMALIAAGILFAAFAANIVVGKIAVVGGATTVPGLGDVGEFLMLFAAVVLFIVACLAYEQAQSRKDQSDTNQDPETNT